MKHLMGSTYFFSCYEDFTPKDTDTIEVIETNEFRHKRQITGRGKCVFQLRRKENFQEYLDWDIDCGVGMSVGKWLVPEFCEEVGFGVDDLPKLQPLIDCLDEKHMYEKIIYESYLENKSFTLTDEQRKNAYELYLSARNK